MSGYAKTKTMKYFHKESLSSTNDVAKKIINKKDSIIDQGFVVTTDKQTAGKGTKGKSWYSESSGGLYYSLAIKPKTFDFEKVETYHIEIAEAISDVILKIANIKATIKWPNDLYYMGKKIGGILMESACKAEENSNLDYLIIGIGLNINQTSFPEDITNTATSLYLETNKKLNKKLFIKPLTAKLKQLFS